MEDLPKDPKIAELPNSTFAKESLMNCKHLGIATLLLLASFATQHTASAQPAKIDTFIRSVFVDSNAGTLLITGTNFGDVQGVAGIATPGGFFLPVGIINWTNTSITAVLPPRPPGNYKVLVLKAPVNIQNQPEGRKDVMAVTIPAPRVRVESFVESNARSCDYSCTLNVTPPPCSCSCSFGGPFPAPCDCSCSSPTTRECSADSCTNRSSFTVCPDVGGVQGASQVVGCAEGGSLSGNNGCFFPEMDATGPKVSCTAFTPSDSCSCFCLSFGFGAECSCSCQPGGLASCTSPTGTATDTRKAVCMQIEDVAMP